MRTFVSFLLERRLIVLALVAALALAGVFAWFQLPIDALPDVTNAQVMILTTAPGLSAEDVEQRVTFPIEQQMRGLPRVRQVRSLSRAELSQVVIVFEDEAETYWTRQVVSERLAPVRERLPRGVEPTLGPISTGLGEIFQYTLTSPTRDLEELRSLQDWVVAPILRPLAGVDEVNSFGGLVRRIEVQASPERLRAFDLTLAELVRAVADGNAGAAGGVIVGDWEQFYLRVLGQISGPADVARCGVASRGGVPVTVAQVADVVLGAETRQGAVSRDGRGEVVAGMVIMRKGENSKQVVDRVRRALPQVRAALPSDVRLEVFYDRSALISACVNTVTSSLLQGGLLVILVLFLFLGELRTALVVALSLPLTFALTFLVMQRLNLTANLMSLGGLAFAVGLVVDASVVLAENMRRHLAGRTTWEERRCALIEAFVEVVRPAGFSIAIIALILVPLFSLQDVEGKMFAPLAAAMLIALLASLAVALVAVPPLTAWLLDGRPEREFGPLRALRAGYLNLLERALRRPVVPLGIAAALLLVAGWLLPRLGTEFLPPLDEAAIAINAVRLPNASLPGTLRVADFVERRLTSYPEIATVVSKSGRAAISEDPMGPEQTDFVVTLRPRTFGSGYRSRLELVEAIRADLEQIPGLRLAFSQPIALRVNELISGVKGDLAIKIFGDDLEALEQIGGRVATVLGAVVGATDVKVEQVAGMAQYDLRLDRGALARHGASAADVAEAVEIAFAGRSATIWADGQRRFEVVVRLAPGSRRNLDDLERLLVSSAAGNRVPLGQLARVEKVEAPAQISRENGRRRVVVEANVRGRDLGGFVSEVRARLAPLERSLPEGSYLTYGGQFENQRRAMERLALIAPLALGLVLFLLVLALGGLGPALLVLLNLPFALVGGVIAVWALDLDLSVSVAIAAVVLLGLAVENGVVLLAFVRQLHAGGLEPTEAVRRACRLRFRPLLMTSATSLLGQLPILLATGPGADLQQPLAAVIIGGLTTSTALTLIVLPVLYSLFFRRRATRAVAACPAPAEG